MNNIKTLKYSTILMLLVLMPVAGCADNFDGERKPGPQGPPPEAISACKDKQEGDSVTFAGFQGESVSATCRTMQGMLVAVPEGHHGRKAGPQGPPPEAISACNDKQEGDRVTFTNRQGETLNGTCKTMQGVFFAVPGGPARK